MIYFNHGASASAYSLMGGALASGCSRSALLYSAAVISPARSCDFTAHMCTGVIHENYKLFVNPLFKTIWFCASLPC